MFAVRCSMLAAALMRVLAIDPSLRGTGFAVLEKHARTVRALDYGTIRNAAALLPSGCLVAIHERVVDLIRQHQPQCAAFEAVIYVQSHRTAIALGAARGAALLAAAGRGLPIYEYAPRRVKQAVVGRGGAQKEQVGFMIRALLGLTETPSADAADALAIGLTHFQIAETAGRGFSPLQRI
jgi:crossover junction endodeoxyribonuclease RuvC